jgi:hypothetical protein
MLAGRDVRVADADYVVAILPKPGSATRASRSWPQLGVR